MPDSPSDPSERADAGRRSFLSKASGVAMASGLVAGYGAFTHVAGRFLYPAREPDTAWRFVTTVDRVAPGASLVFRTPGGARITVARRTAEEGGEFLALSSTCPHLGCQVKWEAAKRRFFCPCHNGVFDATGKGTEGPPADAGQSLSSFPLKIENGLLYIGLRGEEAGASADELELEVDERDTPPGPGHDPVLFERPEKV